MAAIRRRTDHHLVSCLNCHQVIWNILWSTSAVIAHSKALVSKGFHLYHHVHSPVLFKWLMCYISKLLVKKGYWCSRTLCFVFCRYWPTHICHSDQSSDPCSPPKGLSIFIFIVSVKGFVALSLLTQGSVFWFFLFEITEINHYL